MDNIILYAYYFLSNFELQEYFRKTDDARTPHAHKRIHYVRIV